MSTVNQMSHRSFGVLQTRRCPGLESVQTRSSVAIDCSKLIDDLIAMVSVFQASKSPTPGGRLQHRDI
ncbi:hypothetical protein PanWU01x14_016580 [Parasponia andersonii]|uniref:Uncharacterized protein n=1 Tax=Parasponia andersonii TaxID=3476 RepID=A0A2P5DZN8_PARAD|nr:hypothetical protein PanWU01x14_016580 [Parasponia andersonii]